MYEVPVSIKGITFDTTKWESLAGADLSGNAWGHLSGSASIDETNSENTSAFRKWSILPTRLAKEDYPKSQTAVLREKLKYPVAIGLIGIQKVSHPDGERAVARVAAELEVPFKLSTVTCTSFEDVAVANGSGTRWYQLYWPANKNNEYIISLLRRAKASGYTALFVTVDT